jgi:serine/threonine protein kinase
VLNTILRGHYKIISHLGGGGFGQTYLAEDIDHQGNTNLTIAIGSSEYMPIEQLNGKPRFSSDIYAVGMLAIQAITGA